MEPNYSVRFVDSACLSVASMSKCVTELAQQIWVRKHWWLRKTSDLFCCSSYSLYFLCL